jgi:hypothetical protein
MTLTESQRTLVAMSLRIAAEKYSENAEYIRTLPGTSGAPQDRLQRQFEQQSKDTLDLANLIDNTESVEVKE